MTDPAVGACTCASGSQVWNGNSGTLIANATAKARNSHVCTRAGIVERVEIGEVEAEHAGRLVVQYGSQMMASSIRTLPAIV